MVKILDRIKNVFSFQENKNNQTQQISLHVVESGSSGTENYSGYLSEEYLQKLKGSAAADIYDQMRRSDATVAMLLSAITNPIKGASWLIESKDESETGKKIKEFIEHIIFNDLDKCWTDKLGEILTFVPFGFSVFEKTHKVVIGHKKFGNYNGIKALAWRSQKTIERWNLNQETSQLESVSQQSFGDAGKLVDINADNLIIFTLNREGDNFEGISALRPCYGPFLRKNTYLKLIAIGVEKYAVPTPTLKVPEGKETSDQFTNAIEVLKRYVTHQQSYITMPEGWEIAFTTNNFDADKIKQVIEMENGEMIKSFMANFLLLGQSGSGSYALSTDLSDFFLGGIEHLANLICETFNRAIIPELVRLNFGDVDTFPKLKAAGIRDRAGKELAEVVSMLVEKGVITKDEQLEIDLRNRYDLPTKAEPETKTNNISPKPEETKQLSESNSIETQEIKLADPKKAIKDDSAIYLEIMQRHLEKIGKIAIQKMTKDWKSSPDGQKVSVANDIQFSGLADYKKELLQAMVDASDRALKEVRKTVPSKKNIRLAEFDSLPSGIKKRLKMLSDLVLDAQISDMNKALAFGYMSSMGSTDSEMLLFQDLEEKMTKMVFGPSVTTGAANLSSEVVNESRQAFFYDDEVFDQIESFTFINNDPVSPICQSLAGVTFDKNDPDLDRYRPPLHHNCKSTLMPNLVNRKGNPEVTEKKDYKAQVVKNEKYMTLSEQGLTGLQMQSVKISKSLAQTLEDAKIYAKQFGANTDLVTESESDYYFKQLDIGLYLDGSLKSYDAMSGVVLIMGVLKPLELAEKKLLQCVQVSKQIASTIAEAQRFCIEVGGDPKNQDEVDGYYRFTQLDPALFEQGSIQTKEPMNGVICFYGLPIKKLAEDWKLQSVIVKKTSAKTKSKASKLAKETGADTTEKVDETEDSFRFRQQDPDLFSKFRTKELENGVSLIYGLTK